VSILEWLQAEENLAMLPSELNRQPKKRLMKLCGKCGCWVAYWSEGVMSEGLEREEAK